MNNELNKKEQLINTTMSKICLILTIFQIMLFVVIYFISFYNLSFYNKIPYMIFNLILTIISLVLSIISRVKYNDKLSFVLIWVNVGLFILITSTIMNFYLLHVFGVVADNFISGCATIG